MDKAGSILEHKRWTLQNYILFGGVQMISQALLEMSKYSLSMSNHTPFDSHEWLDIGNPILSKLPHSVLYHTCSGIQLFYICLFALGYIS